MKKKIIIYGCNDCAYLMIEGEGNEEVYECSNLKVRHMQGKYKEVDRAENMDPDIDTIEIPEWCPLEDA